AVRNRGGSGGPGERPAAGAGRRHRGGRTTDAHRQGSDDDQDTRHPSGHHRREAGRLAVVEGGAGRGPLDGGHGRRGGVTERRLPSRRPVRDRGGSGDVRGRGQAGRRRRYGREGGAGEEGHDHQGRGRKGRGQERGR